MNLKPISSWLLLGACLCASGCTSVAALTGKSGGETTVRLSMLDRLRGRTGLETHYSQPIEEVPNKLKNPAQLSLAYAKLMEEAGRLEEAEGHYQKALEANSDNAEALLGLARVHFRAGRLESAEQTYHRVLRQDSSSAQALHGLGQICARREQWTEATELLNRAVLAAPGERAVRYDLAVALVNAGNVDAALPHFIRTVGDAEAHYNVGLILNRQGRLAESEQQFQLALKKKPDLEQARYWLTIVQRQQRGTTDPAAAQTAQSAHAVQAPIQTVAYTTDSGSSGVSPAGGWSHAP